MNEQAGDTVAREPGARPEDPTAQPEGATGKPEGATAQPEGATGKPETIGNVAVDWTNGPSDAARPSTAAAVPISNDVPGTSPAIPEAALAGAGAVEGTASAADPGSNTSAIDSTGIAMADGIDVESAATDTGERAAVPADAESGPADATHAATGGGRRRTSLVRAAGYVGAALAGAILAGVLFVAVGAAGGPAPTLAPIPSPSVGPTAAPTGPEATAAPSGDGLGSGIPVDGNTLGSPDAPVTIDIWSDFQCPYCSLLAHAIETDLIRDQVAAGQVRLAYHDYVFLGQESIDAAVAARCAAQQGRFWRYHDLLFATQRGENQGTFNTQFLVNIAGFAGLDATRFSECVADSSVKAAVLAETAKGSAAGVESTPTLIIHGPVATRTIRGFTSWADLLLEIDRSTGTAPIPVASPSPTPAPATPVGSAPTGTSPAGSDVPSVPTPGEGTAPPTGAATPEAAPSSSP